MLGRDNMSQIKLYHGSEYVIEKPEIGKGGVVTDYGKGFYCTKHLKLAGEWACKNNTNGYINEYILNTTNLKILKLDENYNILQWLSLLVDNREVPANAESAKKYLLNHHKIYYKDYDVIIGYRADDAYFTFVRDFLQNSIGVEVLSKAMYLGELGLQVFIQSEKAFNCLKYIKSHSVTNEEYYPKQVKRQTLAEKKYEQLLENPYDGVLISDLIRGGKKYDQSSIPKINITDHSR